MGRRRNHRMEFWVTEREREMIEEKMAQLGTTNMSAYLRKIAIDGYVIRLELPELRELIALLLRSSNNLNQIAARINATSRAYDADIEDMQQNQEQIWQGVSSILKKLSSI